ncbi:MAG: putative Ig domain-containing protein, partial [Pseudomonadota bacterium]
IEMSLGINKDGTLSQYVTLFDALGAVLGGIRPEATTGFATVAPATMPPAVLANLTSTTETTKVGVTSNDNSGPPNAVTSFEVSWDFLLLSSPQASSGVDETGPTASPQLLLPTDASGDIVVNVTYADATGVDAATVDANDVTLTGPAGDGGTPSVAYEPTTGVATYTFAAPLGGWAAGDYTAAVVAGEVADTSTAANTKVGGEQAVGTFTPTLDTELSVTTADVVETGDSGTMPVPFTFALSDTAFTGDVEVTLSIDGAPAVPVTLSFAGGLATFNVDVPVDSRWNGTETATVEIASVVTAGFVADAIAFTATANITEDDPSDNYDKDGALGAPPVQVGDFSDERLSPTDIGELNVGENLISASQQGDDAEGGRDRDFITFTIPEGSVLSQIFLDEYVGSDDGDFQGFMALQEGTAITVDPVTGAPDNPTNPEGPFAGILYGGQVGNDLIPELAAGGSPDGGPVGFPGFVAPLPAGTYTLWLNQGSESSATFRMVVQPVSSDDQPPTVDQGIAAQTTAEDALFSFTVPTDAFADDGGVENLTLTAVLAEGAGALPDWLSFDGTTFSGTPDNDQVGTITVEVSASDGVNAPVATTFELEVTNTNDAPTITGAIAPVSTPEGVATSAELSGLILEDVDVGDMPMFRVELADGSPLPAGITLDATTLNVADTVPQGTYDIAVYANDGIVDSLVPVTFAITVGNPPPQADPVRIQAEDFTSSDGYNAQTQGAAEGGQVIFLPNQGASGTATYDLAAKGVLPGIYDITIGHFDENDGESLINVAISSDATTPFNESFILDDDDTSGNAAQSASFRAKLFSGVEIGENGVLVLTGTTDAFEFARVDFIDFQPVGNTGGGDNTAPFAPFPLPDQMLDENTPFDFNAGVLFADAEEDNLSFTATSDLPDGVLPDGVLFDDATGVFSGSPTIPGIFEITVVANDGEFDSAPASFTLTVIDVSDPPVVVAPIADQTLNQGEVFSLDISASFADPEEETLEFSVDEAELPDGIDFDELTGIFSGTPTGPSGSYLITVTATDPANGSVSDSFLINLLGDDTRPTVLIEAEDGNLVENFFVEAGSRIRLLQEQSGEATYDLSDVAPGDYIIRVGYFDENDGESTIGVAVTSTGQPDFANSFIADDDATSGNKAQAESFRVKTLDGTLSLGPDGVLTLTGQADEFEFVRIDYLELVPVGGGGNFAPVEAGNGAPDISLDGLIPVSGTSAPAFSDPEEDPLTYAKVAGPDWLDVSPVTGALSGTPDAGGVFEVTVSATDVNNNPNAPATSDFTITVDSSGNAA